MSCLLKGKRRIRLAWSASLKILGFALLGVLFEEKLHDARPIFSRPCGTGSSFQIRPRTLVLGWISQTCPNQIEKRLGSATTFYGTVALSFVIPRS
jgi:hypothetical protein